MMRVGVFLPNWIGDVVMATPALRALRKLTDDGALIGIMRPYVAEVLAGSDWFDGLVLYEKKPADPKLGWANVRRKLRDANLDRVVLLPNSFRTAWMAWRSGAVERIGAAANLRSPLLTTRIYSPRNGPERMTLPAIDGYLQLATAAGCPPESPTLELATTAAEEHAADEAWRRLELPRGDRVVVMNTGGAFGAAKDWPAEYFAKLAGQICREHDLHVLVNCGPGERDAAGAIVRMADDRRVTSLADLDDLPLGLTKACIRRCRLLVTTDSGPRFFGVAFGVPTVTLFGPTSTYWTRTYGGTETSLSLGLDCQPCMARTCPLGHHRCMKELTVERVYAAACRALQTPRTTAA